MYGSLVMIESKKKNSQSVCKPPYIPSPTHHFQHAYVSLHTYSTILVYIPQADIHPSIFVPLVCFKPIFVPLVYFKPIDTHLYLSL